MKKRKIKPSIESKNCQIDNLDERILAILRQDAWVPFTEIARRLGVSSGTIHGRVDKLRKKGILKAVRAMLDYRLLGFDVCAFIGINLHNARDYTKVVSKLRDMAEIVEAHYTTGKYSIFAKVITKDTKGLHRFLTEKLQTVKEIQSTETFVSLDAPISRQTS